MTDAMNWGLVHREMLEHVVRGRIYTWAGEPLRRGVEEGHARFDREHRQAFVDLQHGGWQLTLAGEAAAEELLGAEAASASRPETLGPQQLF